MQLWSLIAPPKLLQPNDYVTVTVFSVCANIRMYIIKSFNIIIIIKC